MVAPVCDTSLQGVITLVSKSTEGAAEVEEDSDYFPETDIETESEEAEEEEAEEDEADEALVRNDDGSYTNIKVDCAQQAPVSDAEKARKEAEEAKFIAGVATMPEAADALLRRQVRMYTVIERAKANAEVKHQMEIAVDEGRKSSVPKDRLLIQPCTNGNWIEEEVPAGQTKKRKRRMRMLTEDEMARLGYDNDCACPQCVSRRDFAAMSRGGATGKVVVVVV